MTVESATRDTNDCSEGVTTKRRVEFVDFVDLQTRLVLLPRIEEEGRGAIVASFHCSDYQQKEPKSCEHVGTPNPATSEETEDNSNEEYRDDVDVEGSSTDENELSKNPQDDHAHDDSNDLHGDLKGCVLVGIESSDGPHDWREKDFTSILASIREESTPIVLLFEPADPPSCSSSQPETEVCGGQASSHESSQSAKDEPNDKTLSSSMFALSAWGSRMRATSEKLAAEAASSAASLSSAVAVAAAEAKERAKSLQQQQQQQKKLANAEEAVCDIFLQTSSGAYFPVTGSNGPRSAELKVTTSSCLVVRRSATEPIPKKGYSLQWYRSSLPSDRLSDDAASESGSAISGSRHGDTLSTSSTDEGVIEWVILEGATQAVFQPNATLVGLRLRCLVSVETLEADSDNDSEDELEDVELDSLSQDRQIVVCDVAGPVAADLALFNGARQALARGAKFGGLVGRGNASGRTFRIEVSLAIRKKRRNKVTSSLAIFQVSGNTYEALSDKPVLQASAIADSCKPKHFDLILPLSSENDHAMLTALCTDGKFQLEAPNRLTRESFLLTLGIAGFNGSPADLDATTILYPEEPAKRLILDDSSSSSGSSLSSKSVSLHSASSSKPSSPIPTPPRSPPGSLGIPDPTSPIATATLSPTGQTSKERVSELEDEIQLLRAKLARKDKVVSELQRQLTRSDGVLQRTNKSLSACQQELKQCRDENSDYRQALKVVEKKIQSHDADVLRLQGDHTLHISTLENRIVTQSGKISELEKANRVLQNEKAVLSAGVEARESKLVKMGELQRSFDKLSQTVAQQDVMRVELQESNKRYQDIRADLEKVSQFEKKCRDDLEEAQVTVKNLTASLKREGEKFTSCQLELSTLQKKNQTLKSERNSFKQKGESLSKEISRLCRNGRTLKDLEKIVADHEARREEVEELRKQKRKALEDAHLYRTSYEQSRVAQELSGVDYETRKALERNAELERLLADMTEYVNAKEMQLETMKQINEALQVEIHDLAQANLGKNEV